MLLIEINNLLPKFEKKLTNIEYNNKYSKILNCLKWDRIGTADSRFDV